METEEYDLEEPERQTVHPRHKECHMLLKSAPQCDACDQYERCKQLAAEYYELYRP